MNFKRTHISFEVHNFMQSVKKYELKIVKVIDEKEFIFEDGYVIKTITTCDINKKPFKATVLLRDDFIIGYVRDMQNVMKG